MGALFLQKALCFAKRSLVRFPETLLEICDLHFPLFPYDNDMETKKDVVTCVGFPSPAANYMKKTLDLNEYLIKHPAATFFVRVEGNAFRSAGIHEGDILIVDRSLQPLNGKVVVAIVDGEFVVRRVRVRQGIPYLVSEDERNRRASIADGTSAEVWGVVTTVLHSL